jgi:WD40 repeat protein
MDSQTG